MQQQGKIDIDSAISSLGSTENENIKEEELELHKSNLLPIAAVMS